VRDASSIAAATSGEGGRSPVSALVITVRSNPSERLNCFLAHAHGHPGAPQLGAEEGGGTTCWI
jgi:hypothetical protein